MKDNKEANLLIVGGTIAAGKSTLVDALSKIKNFFPVPELRKGDVIQEIFLKKLYEGKRIHNATLQYYFLLNRYNQYKEFSSQKNISILDRSAWEDWFFAILLMENEKQSYNHYKVLWKSIIKNMVFSFGRPKAYIYLKIDWKTFKKRIFQRNRKVEILNFSKNKEYFKKLLKQYDKNFTDLLKEWKIKTIVIDAISLNEEEVLKTTLKELKKINI